MADRTQKDVDQALMSAVEVLREQWRAWRIFPSREGTLVCASRRQRPRAGFVRRGMSMTLVESSVEALRAALEREPDAS
jgi:hypothetical protein